MEYSEEMMTLVKENVSFDDYNKLLGVMESPTPSMSIHKEFLKKVIAQVTKIFSSPQTRDKIFHKSIYDSNGDITKVKQLKVTLDVLKLLKKSKSSEIKKDAEMLDNLYTQIKAHKPGYTKMKLLAKTGKGPVSIMAELVYYTYVLDVQTFTAAVSLLLAKVHNPTAGNPFVGASMIEIARNELNQYKSGTVKKCINALSKEEKGTTEAIEVAALFVVGTIVAFITLCLSIRILVYYFYYTRMQLADYFEEQAQFLNLHTSEVKRNSDIAARDKDGIMSAQKAWADRFMTLAEMIQDDDIASAKKTTSVIKKVNKEVIPTNQINVPNTGMDFF